jgi:GMP synthase (glutamine-hydrolysing)
MNRTDSPVSVTGAVTVLVLDHSSPGGLGAYKAALSLAGVRWETVRAHAGESLPDWRGYEAIIALGGPMGADDDLILPWIGREKSLIANAECVGVPFWGVCLGAQLLAASLGAATYRGAAPEVGMRRLRLTAAGRRDPVLSGLPTRTEAMEWHQDTFELPAGAVLLASSASFPHQAFRYGRHAYGVQFHLELSPEAAGKWRQVPGYQRVLRWAKGRKPVVVARPPDARGQQMQQRACDLLTRWLRWTACARARSEPRRGH